MINPARVLLFTALGIFACQNPENTNHERGRPAVMFRGNSEHTGVYIANLKRHYAGIRWRYDAGGPVRGAVAVHNDRLYVGSADGSVHALDIDGRRIWRTDLGSPVSSSPAVANGLVIVQSRDNEIVALRAADGRITWRRRTGPNLALPWGHESGDLYISSAVVTDDRIIIGSGDGAVYALAIRDGRVLWKQQTGGRVRSTPAVAHGTVYVGSMDGSVYAFDVRTGAARWRFDTMGRRLRSEDWGFDRRTVQSSAAVVDGAVFIGARDGMLYAIDAQTGKERWHVDHKISWVNTSPAVWRGRVYAGSSDGRFVHSVDMQSGQEIWRTVTPAAVWSSPFISGGTMYVGSGNGTLLAFDALTGQERWRSQIGGGLHASPVPLRDSIVIGNENGFVYALQTADTPWQRLVFYDSSFATLRQSGLPHVRDVLVARGYSPVAGIEAAAILKQAIADARAASVTLVFAIDEVPPALRIAHNGSPLLRSFLDAGGRVVWAGQPPLIFPDSAGRPQFSLDKINRAPATELLGVDFMSANFDALGTTATPTGRARGLPKRWRGRWAVDTTSIDEILAVDEYGNAPAWIKRYARGGLLISLGAWAGGEPDPETVFHLSEASARPLL